MRPPTILDITRQVIKTVRLSGALALDATVGNGHDTCLLADRVGAGGRVVGLDVQHEALEAAKNRLTTAGLLDRVELIRAGHEHVERLVGPFLDRPFLAAMYNLGYLPGSDRRIVTSATTTLASLEAVTRLLHPGGLVTIVAYRGHKGALEESRAVLEWSRTLSPEDFSVAEYRMLNHRRPSPHLLTIFRLRETQKA